jgi:hypothetical protein
VYCEIATARYRSLCVLFQKRELEHYVEACQTTYTHHSEA